MSLRDICPLKWKTHLSIFPPPYSQFQAFIFYFFCKTPAPWRRSICLYLPLPVPTAIICCPSFIKDKALGFRLPLSQFTQPSWVILTQAWMTHELVIQFLEYLLIGELPSSTSIKPTFKSCLDQSGTVSHHQLIYVPFQTQLPIHLVQPLGV